LVKRFKISSESYRSEGSSKALSDKQFVAIKGLVNWLLVNDRRARHRALQFATSVCKCFWGESLMASRIGDGFRLRRFELGGVRWPAEGRCGGGAFIGFSSQPPRISWLRISGHILCHMVAVSCLGRAPRSIKEFFRQSRWKFSALACMSSWWTANPDEARINDLCGSACSSRVWFSCARIVREPWYESHVAQMPRTMPHASFLPFGLRRNVWSSSLRSAWCSEQIHSIR